jgi:hypothetical protein
VEGRQCGRQCGRHGKRQTERHFSSHGLLHSGAGETCSRRLRHGEKPLLAVACDQARAAGPFGSTDSTSAPRCSDSPNSSSASGGTFVTRTPIRPRVTFALLQLRQQVADDVDRHGEADADVPGVRTGAANGGVITSTT